MSFDWKTEDFNWDESTRPPVTPPAEESLPEVDQLVGRESTPGKPFGRRTKIVFLVAVAGILLAGTAALLYWQIERRMTEGRQRAEVDVIASHETILKAAREGDTDLFISFLSGRDYGWVTSLMALVAAGDLINRSNFGLLLPGQRTAVVTPALVFDPDFNTAELTTLQSYDIQIGAGLTETITLSQTATYRRGPDRWLLAPPAMAYWGETGSVTGRYIRLSFPARDAATAQRLARDLEAVLADFCGDLPDGCRPLSVQMSTDPSALSGDFAPRQQRGGRLEIVLPTPTLFGTPVDEASYRAISRQYAARVVTAIVDDYTGWACCDNDLLYRTLQQALLNRLGLLAWPVSDEHYENLLQHPNPLSTIADLWGAAQSSRATNESEVIVPFVEFLVDEARSTSIVEMQRLLVDERSGSFWDWLSAVTGQQYDDPAHFMRDWLRYATDRQPVSTPTTVMPQSDLEIAELFGLRLMGQG